MIKKYKHLSLSSIRRGEKKWIANLKSTKIKGAWLEHLCVGWVGRERNASMWVQIQSGKRNVSSLFQVWLKNKEKICESLHQGQLEKRYVNN